MATDYHSEIVATADRFKLDARLLEAQVLVESSGQTDAFRFEVGIAAQLADGRLKPKHWPANRTMRRLAGSYGLLQVLWVTATDYDFIDEPEMLFIPTFGLEYGARHLAALLAWSKGNVDQALAAFNGGKSGNTHPPYRNELYVARVRNMEANL